jgi:hypothetical protein
MGCSFRKIRSKSKRKTGLDYGSNRASEQASTEIEIEL